MGESGGPLKSKWLLWGILAAACLYRLALMTQYYGWEESDYGNLAMAKGVLDSGFTHYDMRHLPLYYALSAALMGLTGDAVIGTHGVALLSGLGVIYLTYHILKGLFDEKVALLAAALLICQPEVALYSATALREPLYTLCWLGALALALKDKAALSALVMGAAFLTRFDALLSGMPLMVLIPLMRPGPWARRLTAAGKALLTSMAVVGAWSVYCGLVHGDYLFFRSTLQVNVATGGAQEIRTAADFITQGAETSLALLFQILPRKIGWPLTLGALLGVIILLRRSLRQRSVLAFLMAFALNTGFWLSVAFFAQHEPNHNLYWKWMYVLVPFWAGLGSYTIVYYVRRLPRPWAALLGASAISLTLLAYGKETQAQLQMSVDLYKPQLELAQWIEAEVPESQALLLDNIPACYLGRREHSYKLHSWFDMTLPPGDRAAFGEYLIGEDIHYVLWFAEEWTQAPHFAPFLEAGAPLDLGGLHLEPMVVDRRYGFIFYRVDGLPKGG